ncbi:polynucleotide adenylyltransferase PcnB [Thiomicrorhabdus sp. Milos-T2]|uniref:polynucleotide adenylyltransferase PcnB n=1 Tax=Thiomicrorhabdus sp. Milos-T2 TaxID=90814 RepID=UPI000493DA2A|nr:polynucleotide adenylyltransferase PcnB [Thiomicrorhabdus sp. Milos-T2]
MQRIIRKISAFFSRAKHLPIHVTAGVKPPVIVKRQKHGISRKEIDKSALDVLYGLKRGGYDAYLVGGCVRDLLLGLEPKDFDVVTDAEPDQVKSVFKQRCRLIGRRFRLAHVRFGRMMIEVATFRGQGDGDGRKDRFGRKGKVSGPARQVDDSGRLLRDNVYGTIEEDVWRRDFTVNALYYDIKTFSITDYTGGLEDINKGQLRLIGDPETRYREDPVRMIRAIRFASKLGFNIEKKTEKPIVGLAPLLQDVSNARMFEEVLKLFHSGVAIEVFEKLRHYGLFEHLFPLTEEALFDEKDGFPRMMIIEALKSTDARIQSGKSVNPAFLFAAMLWEPMLQRKQTFLDEGFAHQDAFHAACNDVIEQQIKRTAIPKRFTAQMRDIWNLQHRLPKRHGDRAQKIIEHPRFRAAYDFLGVRAAGGETEVQSIFDWWTVYQEKDPVAQVAFANSVEKPQRKKRTRRNRNFYRKRSQSGEGDS